MLGFLALLLVIWIALIVIGAIIKGLFWLIVVGVVLFVITTSVGFARRRS